ncbi:MAG: hypothetical protein ABSG86_21815 [Thermoguttaceae bacterium]|jgi:hypothetical protein
MWRALFLAIGLSLMILGLECLATERVYFRVHDAQPPATSLVASAPQAGPEKQFAPAPWMPWSFLSSGAVVFIYSFTIPRKMGGK